MSDNETIKKIKQILSDSDIVWPKYGSDTIEALAQKIMDKLKEG